MGLFIPHNRCLKHLFAMNFKLSQCVQKSFNLEWQFPCCKPDLNFPTLIIELTYFHTIHIDLNDKVILVRVNFKFEFVSNTSVSAAAISLASHV